MVGQHSRKAPHDAALMHGDVPRQQAGVVGQFTLCSRDDAAEDHDDDERWHAEGCLGLADQTRQTVCVLACPKILCSKVELILRCHLKIQPYLRMVC